MTSNHPSHKQVLAAMQGLVELLQKNENSKKCPPRLSHYREIPQSVQEGYDLLHRGSELIHATSTKYTLVGKVSQDEQKKLSSDLLKGSEIIGAAALVLLQDTVGGSRSLRHATSRATLSILANVQRLVESFDDKSAWEGNVGAQKTGAVWQSCDYVTNRMMPHGNRNAIRRELFAWAKDCQDTMDEFGEIIELGPLEDGGERDVEEEDDEDDMFDGDDERYTESGIEIAKACLPLMKCSKGAINATMQACEAFGALAMEDPENDAHFAAINEVVELTRKVGVGITDFGATLYPPLTSNLPEIKEQTARQSDAVIAVLDALLSNGSLPVTVVELSQRVRTAADTRKQELLTSIDQLQAQSI